MGRELRVLEPDAVLHAGSRGSNRGPIAWDSHDYASLIGEIGRAAARHNWRILAYCVMPNHYHLVVRMTTGGFSAGFQQINGNHSRRTNKRYARDAHLWKNRPWAVPLRSPAQLVGAVVYALRNPIDAGLCRYAHEWPYSSYRAMVGLEPPPLWLADAEALSLFGPSVETAREALAGLVHRGQYPVSDTG